MVIDKFRFKMIKLYFYFGIKYCETFYFKTKHLFRNNPCSKPTKAFTCKEILCY